MKKWIDLRYYYAQLTNQANGVGWDFRPAKDKQRDSWLAGHWYR